MNLEFAELEGHHSPLRNKRVIYFEISNVLLAGGGAFRFAIAEWFSSVLQRVCGFVYPCWVRVPSQVSYS